MTVIHEEPGPADEARPRRGLAGKRRAILTGALAVFARDGYTRASMDAIAAQAGVSTRTIYNHFGDKGQLFLAVIEDSSTQVADAQIVIVDSYLRKVTDLEADLVDFALAWVTSMVDHAEHAALVRQINAELGHIPAAAVDAWQRVGPLRVRRQLANHLARLAERGMLRLDDPDRAAAQFSRLVSVTDSPPFGPRAPSPEEITETVASGVRVFLHGLLIS